MTNKTPVYDILLAQSGIDAGTAEVVKRAFEEKGLSVFAVNDFPPREDPLWEALAESRALVAVLGPSSQVPSSTVVFLTGAAWMRSKPCYLLSASGVETPGILKNYQRYPLSRVSDVVDQVLQAAAPLSDRELDALQGAYRKLGVPSDLLATQPESLQRLTQTFSRMSGSARPADRLLQEVFRLRKSGRLPRIQRSAAGPKAHA